MIEKLSFEYEFKIKEFQLIFYKINEIIDITNRLQQNANAMAFNHSMNSPFPDFRGNDWLSTMRKLHPDIKKDLDERLKDEEKTSGLTFEEAMKFLREGKKIKRERWRPGDCLENSNKCLAYSVPFHAIIENDWEVVD